jgi:hypothetical protein
LVQTRLTRGTLFSERGCQTHRGRRRTQREAQAEKSEYDDLAAGAAASASDRAQPLPATLLGDRLDRASYRHDAEMVFERKRLESEVAP